MAVTDAWISIESSSLSGTVRRATPLASVGSVVFQYAKPWRSALLLGLFLSFLFAMVSAQIADRFLEITLGDGLVGLGLGFVAAGAYYFLNCSLSLGWVESGGHLNEIRFKPSVIEGKRISEVDAAYVCTLAQTLIENQLSAD